MGKESQLCIYHEFCGKGVALEHDGNLYSCDHYVYPEYKLGNILRLQVRAWFSPSSRRQFGFNKFNSLPRQCRGVQLLYSPATASARKIGLIRTRDGEPGLNYLCSGLQKYWHHIDGDVKDICRRIASGEPLRPS